MVNNQGRVPRLLLNKLLIVEISETRLIQHFDRRALPVSSGSLSAPSSKPPWLSRATAPGASLTVHRVILPPQWESRQPIGPRGLTQLFLSCNVHRRMQQMDPPAPRAIQGPFSGSNS